jgi:tRNA (guanine-N7-)-methyltransferase
VSDNEARTAQHWETVAGRRSALSTTFATLLPKDKPFLWEVGSGHGHYLTAYAAAHPSELCIGIDIAKDRVARGTRKQARARLPNLHFLHADSTDFLAAMPDTARFSDIYILFPDPWPKRRHEKNRLIQNDFLKEVAQRAGQGSRIYFRTDHKGYFKAATAVFAASAEWRLLPEAPWPFELETIFQSKADSFQSLTAEKP